jgi:hypothetical protein
MFKLAIPVLHVSGAATAEEFYCNRLRFHQEFAYRIDDARSDPCYMGLTRDGVELHVSSFSGDGVYGGAVFLLVEDVDALHEDLGIGKLLKIRDLTESTVRFYTEENLVRRVYPDPDIHSLPCLTNLRINVKH